MIEVAGVQVRVVEETVEQKLKKYFELMEQIEQLKKEADAIKKELKESGVGINEPQKFEVDGVGIVKVSLKKAIRETLDKKKAKELLPEQLYNQIAVRKEVEMYEIRTVKR